ncbi:hypothetical protein JMK10_03075 [Rhodovulum sulfidophilum]|uniref:hypothetical protein n=1 Tax=Rhodovulum sulfidophilum TaxID=35806 RepID=UPI0019229376|nr:hypothetical protein [Rhodovulum sulfidophilum]MCE8431880.1 hypothetical protein [Rhodovulum sulfidophilum]MCF4115817.1 hypothetical protein [Rhodovulum sulfidophilum]
MQATTTALRYEMSNQIRNVFGDLWNGEWSCGGSRRGRPKMKCVSPETYCRIAQEIGIDPVDALFLGFAHAGFFTGNFRGGAFVGRHDRALVGQD